MPIKSLPDFPEDISDDDIARLYAMQMETEPAENPEPEAEVAWKPSLSPKQDMVFLDETDNTLVVGNRLTGKGWSCGYNLVKHAYDYDRALVLVVLKSKRQGTAGGFFHKLASDILPNFQENIDGFQYKGIYVSQEKDLLLSVKNRHGGISILQMISILHEDDVKRKLRGIEATKVYVDEITLFKTDEVYTYLRGALKRNRYVPRSAQTLLASTNPDDPDHWVVKKWGLEIQSDGTLSEAATNAKNPKFRVITVLKEDNPDVEGTESYYDSLKESLKDNPTQYARDVESRWVSVPKGDAIFKNYFLSSLHVRGDLVTGEILHPLAGHPIILGLDIGDTNHGVVFLQEIPTRDKILWIAFDELVYVGQAVSLLTVTRSIMDKLQHWCDLVGHEFSVQAVSDRSAFDRFRATTGSYDHQEIEKHFRELMPRYRRINRPLRIIPCPKPPGSVESRTRILIDLLTREELFISASCKNLIEMFEKITPGKDSIFQPDTHSPHKHVYDGLGYPIFYHKSGAAPRTDTSDALKPMLTRIGS